MKINLAVIFGGKSVEHEISIISAIQAITNMNTEKYNIIPVYITKSGEFFTGDYLKDIEAFRDIPMTLKKCRKVTFVVNEGKTFLSEISSKLFAGKYNQEIDELHDEIKRIENKMIKDIIETSDVILSTNSSAYASIPFPTTISMSDTYGFTFLMYHLIPSIFAKNAEPTKSAIFLLI